MESLNARVVIGDSRRMPEIQDGSIDLAITSPPYWNIKNYGMKDQIGFNQPLHRYLVDLYMVWKEVYRALKPGSRLCINIGDQFLRSSLYGRYKIVPIHAELISQCEQIGYDYMGSVIWQKKTTMNTTGGANVMGSYPYPKNGILEIDFEFILIFKKPGNAKPDPEKKEKSRLSKEEWKEYFSGHWTFSGERQVEHEAMFPEELPSRLIRMFSFSGDTVLDPFLGSGTTMMAALKAGRNSTGYEINRYFLDTIIRKSGLKHNGGVAYEVIERESGGQVTVGAEITYKPSIKDFEPADDTGRKSNQDLHRVRKIIDSSTIELDDQTTVRFAGITVLDEEGSLEYLRKYVKNKLVSLKSVEYNEEKNIAFAKVYLKNGIFVNRELMKNKSAEFED